METPSKEGLRTLRKSLPVDLFLMLYNLSLNIGYISVNQLVEDKVCYNQLQLNGTFCSTIENPDESFISTANYIITTAADFKNYQTSISIVPTLFIIFFLSYWLDNYPQRLKTILILPAIGGTIGALTIIFICFKFRIDYRFILLTDLIRGATGGIEVVRTGAYTYVTKTTPVEFRALRFAFLEFFNFIAIPISTYLGGIILTSQPWIAGQPRNYIGVFIISAISSTLAILWIWFALENVKSNEKSEKSDNEQAQMESADKTLSLAVSESIEKSDGCCVHLSRPFLSMFNRDIVREMIQTFIKKRENGLRARIWHTMLILACILLCNMCESYVGFPFAQKVYHWDAKYYSEITSQVMVITVVLSSILISILTGLFKLTDTRFSIIGCISLLSSMLIRGTWLSSTGYFISMACNLLSGFLIISVRAFLSRMICSNEIGQIYALLSALESCTPVLASLFYSTIFRATISFNPGFAYLIASILMAYPLSIVIWLDVTKSTWYNDAETRNDVPSVVPHAVNSENMSNNFELQGYPGHDVACE